MRKFKTMALGILVVLMLAPAGTAGAERVDGHAVASSHAACLNSVNPEGLGVVATSQTCLRMQACSYWVPDLFGGLVPAASDCIALFCVSVTTKGSELEEVGISDCGPPGKLEVLIGSAAQAARDSLRSSTNAVNKDAASFKGIYVFGYRTTSTPCGSRTVSVTYRQALMFNNSRKSRTVSKTGASKVKMSVATKTGMATVSFPKSFIDQVTRPSITYSWMVPGQTQGTVVWSPGQSPVSPVSPWLTPQIILGK